MISLSGVTSETDFMELEKSFLGTEMSCWNGELSRDRNVMLERNRKLNFKVSLSEFLFRALFHFFPLSVNLSECFCASPLVKHKNKIGQMHSKRRKV